jgi:hypothetical protein
LKNVDAPSEAPRLAGKKVQLMFVERPTRRLRVHYQRYTHSTLTFVYFLGKDRSSGTCEKRR